MSSHHDVGWDRIYHRHRPECLPWELSEPRKALVELVDSRRVVPGKALDLCCGAGTNPVYLAREGFQVTALDISDKAIEYATEKARKEKVFIHFVISDFLNLPIKSREFDFVFDFGCFHHVEVKDRVTFIKGVQRVLKPESTYFMVCFSHMNGPAWNHLTKEQIVELFGDSFDIQRIRHVSSTEGDGITRYFYEVLMENHSIRAHT